MATATEQTRSVLGAQDNPLLPTEFRPGEHWLIKKSLYRVAPCPLITSCLQLIPLASGQEPLYRHPSNTNRFQRLWP